MAYKNTLPQAKKFYEAAVKEFTRARAAEDEVGIRQSAEKGWGAVVQAANAFILSKGAKPPRGTQSKLDLLDDMEEKFPLAKRIGIARWFGWFMHSLHMDCFYDGRFSVKRLERDLRRVGHFIAQIEKVS